MSMRAGWVSKIREAKVKKSKSSVFAAVCVNAMLNLSNTDSARPTRYLPGEPLLKKQIRDSETLRKKFETARPKETHEKRDFVTRQKSFRDFEIRSKISEIHDFLCTIRHPYQSCCLRFVSGRGRLLEHPKKSDVTVCVLFRGMYYIS